jgi:hypothetical protein
MEWTVILLLVGAVAIVVLALIAIRGSFRSDDAFYGGSTTVAASGPVTDDRHEDGVASDGAAIDGGPAPDGGTSGDGGSGGGGGDGGGAGSV